MYWINVDPRMEDRRLWANCDITPALACDKDYAESFAPTLQASSVLLCITTAVQQYLKLPH